MSEFPTPEQRLRCVALEAVSRCVPPDTPTSGLLSRAYQAETYLTTGLIRTGPKWLTGAEVGCEGVSVMVEAEGLGIETAERIREAVRAVL